MSQPGVVAGAVYEFHAARARIGKSPGVNSPLTTALFDTSGNANHGTLINCDGTEWGGTGTLADPYALTFNGTDEYMTVPVLSAADTREFTYEAWVLIPSIPAENSFVVQEAENGYNKHAALIANATTGYGRISVDYGDIVTCGNVAPNICDNVVHHIIGTADGTSLRYYVDQVLKAGPTALPADSMTSVRTRLGVSETDTAYLTAFLPGSILVARIYPFGLSVSEVEQNFDAGYLWTPNDPTRHGIVTDVDDTLWQVTAGNETDGWRDITDEVGDLTFTHVRPGGPGSCSFTVPADVWSHGYNELQPDQRIVVRYAGEVVWGKGYILPRGIDYQGG